MEQQNKYKCKKCGSFFHVDSCGFWCKTCDKAGGDTVTVDYQYTDYKSAEVPSQVVDSEDEEEISEYIRQWVDDAENIEITSY